MNGMTISLPGALMEAIRSHAEAGYPREICGFLLGEGETAAVAAGATNIFVIRRILPADNRRTEEAGRRYLIDPDQYRAAERRAEMEGLDLVGVYHSHPDHPARPSEYDREHAWPSSVYVIVSVTAGGAVEETAWLLAEDRSTFLPLAITRERSLTCPRS